MEPALFFRREGDSGTAARRHGEHRDIPPGATEGIQMGIRRDSQGRSEHPARRPETEKRVGTLRLRDRQEHQTHSETLLWQGFPQYGGNGPDRERLRGTECGQCHLRREQEQAGEDRGHQFRGKRSLHGQKAAAHTEKDASGQPQHLPEFQAQRDRLRRGQGESARLLQFAGIP